LIWLPLPNSTLRKPAIAAGRSFAKADARHHAERHPNG
jgi:hypothetical protein